MTWARPWIRPALLSALGSLLICLSVPPVGWWWLAAIAWAPLTLIAAEAAGDRQATRRVVIVAWIVALGRWMWLELWIREVSDAGWPALAMLMACYDGLFAWAVARSEASPRQSRWPLAARTAVLLVGCEWLRGRVFLEGYPWFMPAQPLIEWPTLAQGADLVGAAGMGLLPAALAGACADLLLRGRDRRRARAGVIAAASLWLAAITYGAARISAMPPAASKLRVLAVQTNVAQSNKDAPDRAKQDRQFGRLLELTVDGLAAARSAGEPVDLVAWPETRSSADSGPPTSTRPPWRRSRRARVCRSCWAAAPSSAFGSRAIATRGIDSSTAATSSAARATSTGWTRSCSRRSARPCPTSAGGSGSSRSCSTWELAACSST